MDTWDEPHQAVRVCRLSLGPPLIFTNPCRGPPDMLRTGHSVVGVRLKPGRKRTHLVFLLTEPNSLVFKGLSLVELWAVVFHLFPQKNVKGGG